MVSELRNFHYPKFKDQYDKMIMNMHVQLALNHVNQTLKNLLKCISAISIACTSFLGLVKDNWRKAIISVQIVIDN